MAEWSTHYKGAIVYRGVHVMSGTTMHKLITEQKGQEARQHFDAVLKRERDLIKTETSIKD